MDLKNVDNNTKGTIGRLGRHYKKIKKKKKCYSVPIVILLLVVVVVVVFLSDNLLFHPSRALFFILSKVAFGRHVPPRRLKSQQQSSTSKGRGPFSGDNFSTQSRHFDRKGTDGRRLRERENDLGGRKCFARSPCISSFFYDVCWSKEETKN